MNEKKRFVRGREKKIVQENSENTQKKSDDVKYLNHHKFSFILHT